MNSMGRQTSTWKPTLDYHEIRRRSRLQAILRDVRRVLDHEGKPASSDLACLVTLAVADLAAIERMSDADEMRWEWVSLIEMTLNIDPWDADALWQAHAVTPIQAEATGWRAHKAQAVLKAEPAKFHHRKLIEPAAISAILGLTRKRITKIFGSDKCSLPPAPSRKSRFPKETLAQLRALSKEVKKTPEYLGDILESKGEAGLQTFIEQWKADLEKWSIRSRKRGRKVDPSNATNLVKSTAKQLRKSERTIWNRLRDKGAETPESAVTKGPETPESVVTFAVESCHVCSGIVRSAIPDFQHVSEIEIPENQSLDILAEVGRSEKLGRRKPRSRYLDRDLVIAWWEATRGRTPTPGQMRQWMHRNQYVAYAMTARAWAAIQGISSPPADPANAHVTKHHVEIKADDRSTRLVRGPDADPATAPRPVTQAEGNPHGRG